MKPVVRRLFPIAPNARECGPCTACCVVYDIEDGHVNKVAHDPCSCLATQGVGGCARYDERPRTCRDFECLWKKGIGPEEHRPDRVGVVFTVNETGIKAPWAAYTPDLHGHKKLDPAMRKTQVHAASFVCVIADPVFGEYGKTALAVIDDLADDTPVFVRQKDKTRALKAPPEWAIALGRANGVAT